MGLDQVQIEGRPADSNAGFSIGQNSEGFPIYSGVTEGTGQFAPYNLSLNGILAFYFNRLLIELPA